MQNLSFHFSLDHISTKFAFIVVGVGFVWREEVVKLFLLVFPFEGNDKLFD